MRRRGSWKQPSRKPTRHSGARWERQSVRHALRRLWERYGIVLDTAGYEALCAAIRLSPDVGYLYRPTLRESWYLVRIDGQTVLAVWDAQRGRIRTFLELHSALATIGLKLDAVLSPPAGGAA